MAPLAVSGVLWALCLALSCTIGQGTSSVPSSMRPTLRSGAIVGGAVIFGVLGKQLYDGPEFKETVDLTGKVVAITGSNTGLGFESALKIASLGTPTVLLLCRNQAKAQAAVDRIKEKTGNPNVSSVLLDLEDLASVRRAAKEINAKFQRLDVLQLNSGVMAVPTRETTKDGFEKQMGINHLGHFALTRELWPLVKKTPGSRVITVSSSAHLLGALKKDDLMLQKEGSYGAWTSYGNSKLANILFARELHLRLQQSGNPGAIISTTLHPGAVRTELGRYIFDPAAIPKFLLPVLGVVGSPLIYFTKSPYMGAQTQTMLSASALLTPATAGGIFFDNSKAADTSAAAKDEEMGHWLWGESERLTGGKFDL